MRANFLKATLATMLCVGTSQVSRADWLEARTPNFIVIGDWTEEKLVEFAKRVEHYDQALRITTRARSDTVTTPVRILVMRDAEAVRELRGVPKQSQLEGFYRTTLRGPLAVTHRERSSGEFDLTGEAILFHEHAHHFVTQHFAAAYPSWYLEGFAEYHSTVAFAKNGDVEIGLPPPARLPSLVLHKWLPLRRMLDSKAELTSNETYMLRAQAWLLTHYMHVDPARSEKLAEYLRSTTDGADSREAMEHTFERSLEQLDEELKDYFALMRRKGIRYRRFTALALKDPVVSVRRLTPAEVDSMSLDAALGPRAPTDRYAELQSRAAELVGKYPSDPFALTIAAEVAFATEQYADAEAFADRALAASPKAQRALTMKGAAQLFRLRRGDADFTTPIGTIRSTLVRANRANPNDPMALYYFFRSFEIANEVPTENAITGLLSAYELSPQSTDVRFALARELIRQGKLDKAAIVLKPLAYSPHASGAVRAANDMLAKIAPQAVARRALIDEAQSPAPAEPPPTGEAAKPK